MSFEPRLYDEPVAPASPLPSPGAGNELLLPDHLQALAEQLFDDASHLAALYPAGRRMLTGESVGNALCGVPEPVPTGAALTARSSPPLPGGEGLNAELPPVESVGNALCGVPELKLTTALGQTAANTKPPTACPLSAVGMAPGGSAAILERKAAVMIPENRTWKWVASAACLLITIAMIKPITNPLRQSNSNDAVAELATTPARKHTIGSPADELPQSGFSQPVTGENLLREFANSANVANLSNLSNESSRELPPNVLEGLSAPEQEAVLDLLEQRVARGKGLSI